MLNAEFLIEPILKQRHSFQVELRDLRSEEYTLQWKSTHLGSAR